MQLRRWDRNLRKHRVEGHSIVAVGMVRRNVPLIPPEEMSLPPGEACSKGIVWLARKQRVESLWRGTARQCNRKAASRLYRFHRQTHALFCRRSCQILTGFENANGCWLTLQCFSSGGHPAPSDR